MSHALFLGRFNRPSLPDYIEERLLETECRMEAAHQTHLGYPYNLTLDPPVPAALSPFLINNLGDPYGGSTYGANVHELEREAMAWLMRLWGAGNSQNFWGSVGASGTEGNIWGLHLGREAFPDAVVLHSADAHCSVPKAARLLRIDAVPVSSTPSGEIDLQALADVLPGLGGRPVIMVLTCGTTMKGAHDDIAGAIAVLEAAGLGPDRRFVHVDGALSAMVVPFLPDAPDGIRPMFDHGIDSISTSGHKMIGAPMPCGAMVARKVHVDRMARAVTGSLPHDPTLMGSRNGHAVLAMWARFFGHGHQGFARDAQTCTQRAQWLAGQLRRAGADVLCNPHSLTVVFDQPDDDLVQRYQLACQNGRARAVVMPNVTTALLRNFVADYSDWLDCQPRAAAALTRLACHA